jgi:protein SCO1
VTAPRHAGVLWGLLLAAMAAVTVVFFRSTPRITPLPVLAPVAAFQLTNQFGLAVTRESLEGFVWVADVVFSRCPGQCHELSQQMRRVQDRLPKGRPVRLVSLSADPAHDTPSVLLRYGTRYGCDSNRWYFLTGPKADVYRLAIDSLKFSVVDKPEGERTAVEDLFIHSSAFAVVDRSGRLRAMVQGELPDAEERILGHIRTLLDER